MNELLWYVTRAAGLVAVVLLTTTLVLGVLTAGRAAPVALPAFVRTALHRTLALTTVVFVVLHVVTAVAETYVDLGWVSAVVPFTAGYETAWVGLGAIAFDLFATVLITSLLRGRLRHRAWKLVHLASYLLWPLALAHGIGSASVDGTLVLAVTLGCAALGGTAVVWRLVSTRCRDARRSTAALAASAGWR
jgi:sulfoxide reductase heme-binding subunit YedZ